MNNKLKRELENLKGESELENAVINIALNNIDNYDNAEKYFLDVLQYGCQSGIVSELIYYYQTEKFFDTHANEIFDLYNELVSEYGQIDMELNKNNLAWLAFEETLRNIAYDLDIEI